MTTSYIFRENVNQQYSITLPKSCSDLTKEELVWLGQSLMLAYKEQSTNQDEIDRYRITEMKFDFDKMIDINHEFDGWQ